LNFLNFLPSILFLLVSVSTLAQTSLESRVRWMESVLSEVHDRKTDSLMASLESKLHSERESNDKIGEARTGKELGLMLLSVPDYEKAITLFIRSLQIEDSLSLKEEQVITYIAMAEVFEQVGDYQKSAELLDHAVEISRPFDEVHTLVYILNRLGKINALRGRREEAREYYELVLQNKERLSDRKPEGDALYNLAHLNSRKGEYAKALEFHKRALTIRREMQDKSAEAQSLNDIGELYRLMKNEEKAFANHLVALRIRSKTNDLRGLAESYNNIGVLYYLQRNLPKAIANLQLGLDAAKTAQWADQSAKSYEYLSLCMKESGDFQKALEHHESYVDLIEFMRSEKVEMDLLETQNRYVLEKKELEIRQLELVQRQRELELETQKKIQNILFVLIGFGVIIVLLVFYLYLIKRRANISLEAAHARVAQQNVELQNLNATKDKFFSIISHDLKGPLNSFTAFSGMLINHTDDLTKEEIQMLAKEIDKNLKNLFALLENLLEWSRSQTGNIEFTPTPFDLSDLLRQNQELLSAQAKNKNITLAFSGTGKGTVNAHKNSVNTVIRNLVSNAIKFTPEGGRITLELKEGNDVEVRVTDTGVGMSPETISKLFRIDTKYSTSGTANEKGTGLGLILCKDFIEKNGGSIGVFSEPGKGSTFYFRLPVHTNTPTPTSLVATEHVK
jgi:signal transduction histidine kinase